MFISAFAYVLWSYLQYGAVIPRFRIKTLADGKYVAQFLCLGKVPDLGIKSELWGWYPLMVTDKAHVSFMYKKEFESSASVLDYHEAETSIKKFKERCNSRKKQKVTYTYLK